jgi:large subunit ribosomal protein L25
MSTIKIVAELRQDHGKGASRRLRRLNNQVPAVVYGGDKAAVSIQLPHNKVIKALEDEHFYASVLSLEINGSKQKEQVILKALQRHPYKPVIVHMDFQRVSLTDEITKVIPIHFTNEEMAPGVKDGGMVNHHMNQLEIRCQVKNLPDHIDIDLSHLEMDQVLHLADLKLPKGVELTVDCHDEHHNLAVASIHMPRVEVEPEEEEVALEAEAETETAAPTEEPSAE